MREVIGVAIIVVGAGQILLRERIARANAASNSILFKGRMSGPGWQRYSRSMSVVVGAVLVVVGVLVLAHLLRFGHR